MKSLLLVSRCLSCRKDKNLYNATLHFRGQVQGQSVTSVEVKSPDRLRNGRDYLLHLSHTKINNGTLQAQVAKFVDLAQLKGKI